MKTFDNLVPGVDQHFVPQVEPEISQPNHSQITDNLSWGESFEESYQEEIGEASISPIENLDEQLEQSKQNSTMKMGCDEDEEVHKPIDDHISLIALPEFDEPLI